jgi:DNA-binding CsgD family transcriptional regulator
MPTTAHRTRPPELTAHLIQTARHIAEGATNAQIATRMHLSREAVQSNVSRLMAATGTTSRTQAAICVIEQALIPSPGGRIAIDAQDLRMLISAVRRAGQVPGCAELAGFASRFEAAYPVLATTAPQCGATLQEPFPEAP